MRTEPLESVSVSDIAPGVWPPLRWLLSRPRLVDSLIIAVSVVPPLIALSLSGSTHPVIAWIAVALTGAALWWRRANPFWVFIALAAINSLYPPMSSTVAFVFTGFTLAYKNPFHRVVGAFLTGLAAMTGAAAIWQFFGAEPGFVRPVVEPVVQIAMILGLAARGRRDRRIALAELINQRIENSRQLERTRIAAEMHDVVAHSLSVMIALADGALAARTRNPEQSAEALEHLAATGRSALGEMQTIIGVLRTSDEKLDGSLDDSGYNVPPLEDLVEVFRAAHLPVVLVREGDTSGLPPNLQTAVYRIAQEALTNALRYAQGATRVELRVTVVRDRLTVRVSDDGAGGADFEHGTGQGLVGIRERAKLLGGSASAGPGDEGGWVVEVGVPVGSSSAKE